MIKISGKTCEYTINLPGEQIMNAAQLSNLVRYIQFLVGFLRLIYPQYFTKIPLSLPCVVGSEYVEVIEQYGKSGGAA
jgi:hypothetical protein